MSSSQILDGKKVKTDLLPKVKQRYDNLTTKPHLVVIQIGNYQENELYLRQKRKMAEYLEVSFTEVSFSSVESSSTILKKIESLNQDPNVHGIMIQSPVPPHLSFFDLVEAIDPRKDVDALTSDYQQKINQQPLIVPATVRGIIELLTYYQLFPKNQKVVVIGKSRLAGLPLSKILEKNNEVVLCDSKTEHIEEKIKSATYIFIAIGKPRWLKQDMIQEGAIIIDIGTNLIDGKLMGDCDYSKVLGHAYAITPVPGGVGPLTVVSLFENLIDLYEGGR